MAENTIATPANKEIDKIYANLLSIAKEPDANNLYAPPTDYKPVNQYYSGTPVNVPERRALEERNYNIDDAYTRLNDGTYIAKYDNYKVGRDNAEYAALTQSTTDKWINGLTKALGKTGTAILGGTAGVVYSAGKLAQDGSITSMYDNDFTNWMDDLNTKMDYNLPNYYTRQETEKGLGGQLTTANFWADKVLGGLSFTAGAIISEGIWAYATGGASLGGRFARWGSESLGLGKVAQGVAKYKGLLKSPLIQAYKAGNISKNTAIALGKTGDALNTLRFTMTSAGYEASVEALQYKNEQTENFYNNFYNLNGRNPNEEDVAEFTENLENSSNAVFGLNMAIVGSSNVLMLGSLFNLKNPIKTGIGEFIDKKAFGRGVTSVIDDAGKVTYQAIQATKAQNIARNIYNYSKNPLREGLYEEGGQGVITKAAGKWLEASYNPQLTTETADTSGLVFDSLAEQFGTKEGWVENGVGIIIGALGGTGIVRSESNRQNQEIELRAAGLNTFQQDVIAKRFLLMNQMNGFANEAASEQQKGNISKSKIANDGTLYALLNHKYQLGEDVNDAVNEAATALDTMTADQFREAGVAEADIDAFKTESVNKYSQAAKDFLTNRKYAEYIIGRNRLIGEEEVLVQGDEALGTNTHEALVQSLTWNLTAASSANTIMGDIHAKLSEELGSEQTNVINTLSQLKRQQSSTKGQITKNVNQLKALTSERDRLQAEIIRVQNAPQETEGDRVAGAELGQLNLRLLEVEGKINELNTSLESTAKDINTQTEYQKNLVNIDVNQVRDFTYIGAQDLINLNENLNQFKNLIEGFKVANPQRYEYLTDLLDEYTQSEQIFESNQRSNIALSSGQLKPREINNWLSKMVSKRATMDEFTRDWLVEVLQTYQNNKVFSLSEIAGQEPISNEIYQDFVDNDILPEEILNSLVDKTRRNVNLSEREQEIAEKRSEEINNLIKESVLENPIQEDEEVLDVRTPLQRSLDRLNNLLKTNYNSLSYIGENYSDLMLQKPSKAEIEEYRSLLRDGVENERFQLLTEKLGNWRLLDSAVAEENQSVADLLDLIQQLETQIEQEDVKDTQTEEDVAKTVAADKEGVTNTTVRYDLGQNTLANATAQILKDKGIVKFSHLKMSTIINKLGIPTNSERLKITDAKGKPIKIKSDSFDNYKPGTVFYIDNTKITIGARNTLEIKQEDYTTLRDELNLHIIVPTVNWSYFDVYETVGDTARKVSSDFQEDINPQLIYDIKPDSTLGFAIADDDFNRGLRDRVLNGQITPELENEIEQQLKIYITYKGQAVSVLKATNQNVSPDDNFRLLRQAAKEAFLANPMNPKISAKAQSGRIFIGSPEITTENLRSVSNPITSEAVQNVISTGYIQAGELVLSREVSEVSKTYLSGIDETKKTPIIVFKKGAYNIAYPVSLIKYASDDAVQITSIVESNDLSNPEKVKAINEVIINTGIAADKRLDFYDEVKIEEIKADFAANETFISMAAFSNPNYNFNNLPQDIKINIDLTNLDRTVSDAKLEIKIPTIQLQQPAEDKYNSLKSIEDRLSELTIELATDYTTNADTKYVNSKGEIVEDTVYTNAFDDANLFPSPANQLQKISNLKVLEQAFSAPLPKTVANVLSPQTIEEVKYLLNKYSFYKNQTLPDKNAADQAREENTCG